MQIVDAKHTYDVLVPDGRELREVRLDGEVAVLLSTVSDPGVSGLIHTYACDRPPVQVMILFKP